MNTVEKTEHLLQQLVEKYPELQVCAEDIRRAYQILCRTFEQGGKLLVFGNGGSAADAEHIVGELMKGYRLKRPLAEADRSRLEAAFPGEGQYLSDHLQGALPAISLVSQTALLTAFANDIAPEMVFAQQVYGYGRPGDAVLAISTTGRSANVVRALQVAKAIGLGTIGLSGRNCGAMQELCDVVICAPEDTTTSVQERHLPIYHTLCAMLEDTFFT